MLNITTYKPIIQKLYNLSCTEAAKSKSKQSSVKMHIDLKQIRQDRESSELLSYLEILDADTIKVVLAVMYIGRDYEITEDEYRKSHPYEEDIPVLSKKPYPVPNPDKAVEEKMMEIPANKDKNIDIQTIYSKRMLLNEYFARAMKILNI